MDKDKLSFNGRTCGNCIFIMESGYCPNINNYPYAGDKPETHSCKDYERRTREEDVRSERKAILK